MDDVRDDLDTLSDDEIATSGSAGAVSDEVGDMDQEDADTTDADDTDQGDSDADADDAS